MELARRIYFAARGADWDTVHPIEVRDLRIQATRRTFKAEWVARCRGGEVDYEWAGQIRGESNGNLSFEVQGRTLAAFSSPRIGLNVDYNLAWLRQEENQYLSCPPEIAKDYAPEIQRLCGYTVRGANCGTFCDFQ